MINISEELEGFVERLRVNLTNEIMSTLEDEKFAFLRVADFMPVYSDENLLKALNQEKYSLNGFPKNGGPSEILSFEFSLGTLVKEEPGYQFIDQGETLVEVREYSNGYGMKENECNLLHAVGEIVITYPASLLSALVRYYPHIDKGFLDIKTPLPPEFPKSTKFLQDSLKEEAVAKLKRKKEELKKQKERIKKAEEVLLSTDWREDWDEVWQ